MKKFSKLMAFFFAFILVAGLLNPLATAKAATAEPKFNATSKTLFIGGSKVTSTKGTYTLKISNRPSSYSIAWKSDNEDVVTVKKGSKSYYGTVKAVGVGTAYVTATVTNKKTKEAKTLKCKFTVKNNADSVVIGGKDKIPASLEVGKQMQLSAQKYDSQGRGGSKYVTDGIKFASLNTDVATCTAKGLVTIVGEGTAEIVCFTYQSSAYKKLSKATALDSFVITGTANTLVSAKQTKTNAFELTFGTDVSKTLKAADLTITAAISGTESKASIKEITFDSTGKVATVKMNSNFFDKAEIKVVYTDAQKKEYTKSFTASNGEIAKFTVSTADGKNIAVAGTPVKLVFKFYDANGIDVTPEDETAYKNLISSAQMLTRIEEVIPAAYYSSANQTVLFYEAGKTATVKSTYYTLKSGITQIDASAVITSVSEATTLTFVDYMITNSTDFGENLDWTKAPKMIAANDTGYRIVAKFKTIDGKYLYTDTSSSKLKFKLVSDTRVTPVLVTENGTLTTMADRSGTGVVSIEYTDGNVLLQTLELTISPKRVPATMVLDKREVVVSNVNGSHNYAMAKFVVKLIDNYGNPMAFTSATDIVASSNAQGLAPAAATTLNADGTITISINAQGAAWGNNEAAYQYEVKYGTYLADAFVLRVKKPVGESTFLLNIDATYDMKLSNTLTELPNVPMVLYEMKNGVKYDEISLKKEAAASIGEYFYSVRIGGTVITDGIFNQGSWAPYKINAGEITKLAQASYTVIVFKKTVNGNEYVTTAGFTLIDTQEGLTVTPKSDSFETSITITNGMAPINVALVVSDVFNVRIGSTTVPSSAIVVSPSGYDISAPYLVLKEVGCNESFTIGGQSYYITQTCKVGQVIKSK